MKKKLRNKSTANSRQPTVKLSLALSQLTFVALMLLVVVACSPNKQTENADTYICPMHPTVVSDRPSTCPVCGMDLVRKARPGEEVQITEDLARLIKSPNEVVVASINTVKTEYKAMTETIQVSGIVTYDTRYLYSIPTRTSGRLEKVYLKYAFQPISKGQHVADIYSPELLTAQRELLYLIQNDKSNEELIQAARNKLLLLGLSEKQLGEIIDSKEAKASLPIFSQHNGYVISASDKPPTLSATSSTSVWAMDGSMGGGNGSSTLSTEQQSAKQPELIREGSYVTTGQTLFNVVNTSALRVELNLAIAQAATIKTGDKILLDLGTENREAKVDFIQPFFSDNEAFVKLRVNLPSQGLHIGQLILATYNFQTKETLWLPKEAILDLGVDNVVFVKERGGFKPRKIITGIRLKNVVEVKGLASSDEVAANAQYLVDSESFIKSK